MPAHRTRTEVIDCDCKRYRRPHGTAHGYETHHCGCDPCRKAANRDTAERREYPRLVPAEPTRQRIEELREAGMTLTQIARAAGCAYSTVERIARPTAELCNIQTAEDIAGVPIPAFLPVLCSVKGCHREHKARGLCSMHYQRVAKRVAITREKDLAALAAEQRATPEAPRPLRPRRCAQCPARAVRDGLCSTHYLNNRRNTAA